MTNLLYDVARCAGTLAQLCRTCRRREPGHPTLQTQIAPEVEGIGCKNYLPENSQRIVTTAVER